MRLSFNSAVPLDYTEVGFGQVASNVYKSMLKLGWQVSLDDRSAPIQLHWKQPQNLLFYPKSYTVAMLPWESTEFRTGWLETLNSNRVDEVFTTSDWCKQIFENLGIEKKITVFPHGINAQWTPKLRTSGKNKPLRYLIVDAEANRKGWQEAFDAFRAVFKDDPRKATLTIKSRQRCMARWYDGAGMVRSPSDLPNVKIDISKKTDQEMVDLFHNHDVILFPSYGEGFGLIPFQFLATGGIAIVTEEWCHYKDYLGDFGLKSHYARTKWEGEHPGDMCHPDQQHLEELIQKSYDEFEDQSKTHFKNAFKLHKEYNWLELTDKALKDLPKSANAKFDAM